MLGQLKLPLTARAFYTVTGGPSHEAKDYDMVFVKMAKELRIPCDISIPTRDFDVPALEDLNKGLAEAVDAVLAGKALYVGCMAGRGRTGLFLAVLARAFGVENPVEYVRKNYYPHAVETESQYHFVMTYPLPSPLLGKIARKRRLVKWMFWKKGLTNL